MIALGNAYSEAGRHSEALPLLKEALALRRKKLGPEHPDTLASMWCLADFYCHVGRHSEAVTLLETTLSLSKSKLGPEHPQTIVTMGSLGREYAFVGRLDEGITLMQRTLELSTIKLGREHPNTLDVMCVLGFQYFQKNELDKSVPLFEEVLPLRRKVQDDDHPETIRAAINLAVNYRNVNRIDEAERLSEEWLPRGMEKLGLSHPITQFAAEVSATTFERIGRPSKSEEVLRILAEYWKTKTGPESSKYASALAALGTNLLGHEKLNQAEPILQECLTIREKNSPEEWTTPETKTLLGVSLLAQKKFAEAEPLILTGYQEMKSREVMIPALEKIRLTEALERLVHLYEAWEKPNEATKWKALLATSPKLVMATSRLTPQLWRHTTDKPGDEWIQASFNDETWPEAMAPFGGNERNYPIRSSWTTSDLWLRRAVQISRDDADKLVFMLFDDDDCELYLNGILLAKTVPRRSGYAVTTVDREALAKALASGNGDIHCLAVHCFQTTGGQFFDMGIVRE